MAAFDARENLTDTRVSTVPVMPAPGAARIEQAIIAARDWLIARQQPAGFWCEELEGDATLESYMILLETFLGRRASDKSLALARVLRGKMLPTGGWSQYPDGPPEISVSCLAYCALKWMDDPADVQALALSREVISGLGGVESANTYTKYHLALFGQYSWQSVPAIPPEMMFLPRKGPFSIDDMSSWSRTIFVPLSILYAHKPICSLPAHLGVQELFASQRAPASSDASVSDLYAKLWRRFFFAVDAGLKRYERLPGAARLRRVAIERAASWMIERLAESDGLSAILPAMANSVMALKVLGYADDHPLQREQLGHLDGLLVHADDGSLRMQPCLSPVWDTVLSCHALIQTGLAPDAETLRRAASWLLAKQTRLPGDWSGRNPAAAGGWYFEYRNEFYPDVDDTCMALMVLAHARAYEPETEQAAAMERGLTWMLQMQNRDGGWGAFDRDNDKQFLTHVPFADHNAMIDPSTADITARVLECLSHFPGFDASHPLVAQALDFLRRDQTADGSWYGRWGVNYLYGTWQVLRGLRAIGADMTTPHVQRAVHWLVQHQNSDGGWGESIASYDDTDRKGIGASTPSQTAWALMGLIAAQQADSQAVRRGVRYLIDQQDSAGTWQQALWTGTGFPRVFYLNYHSYRHHFPLQALAQYRNARLRTAASAK
jgi:squalene-hopene/tetraprenyl-beta-curcumene cyclase